MNTGEMGMMSSCLMPFGIMTSEAGKWMVGYQFMHEKMDGSLVGTDDISVSQILKQFPNAPTDMTMDMHMWMVMYAPTERLTLSAMIPYVRKEMNMVDVDGAILSCAQTALAIWSCACVSDLADDENGTSCFSTAESGCQQAR